MRYSLLVSLGLTLVRIFFLKQKKIRHQVRIQWPRLHNVSCMRLNWSKLPSYASVPLKIRQSLKFRSWHCFQWGMSHKKGPFCLSMDHQEVCNLMMQCLRIQCQAIGILDAGKTAMPGLKVKLHKGPNSNESEYYFSKHWPTYNHKAFTF